MPLPMIVDRSMPGSAAKATSTPAVTKPAVEPVLYPLGSISCWKIARSVWTLAASVRPFRAASVSEFIDLLGVTLWMAV
jgi:hypothetical protein